MKHHEEIRLLQQREREEMEQAVEKVLECENRVKHAEGSYILIALEQLELAQKELNLIIMRRKIAQKEEV